MNENKAGENTPEVTDSLGPYKVYSAGELFTQDELATNVLIKKAVWHLSNGKF